MQRLAITDPSDPAASGARSGLGRELGKALQEATTDPARMLPLWTAFSRGEPVRASDLRRAVSAGFVDEAVRHELLLSVDVGEDEPWLRGTVCVVAADVAGELLWVASDFPWYDDDPDAVSGPGEASATLLSAVPVAEPARVLDMGCGSGAVGVRLAGGAAGALTATDVNPRALALTELTAALNDVSVRTVRSDFAADVDGTYDLLVCNPPFVLRRPDGRTTFRDCADTSGYADLGVDLAALLAVGGFAAYLSNWEYPLGGPDPLQRLGERLAEVDGCDVLVLERAVVPVPQYVAVWTEDEQERHDWAAAFAEHDVAHVGTGIVVLRRTDAPTTLTLAKAYDLPRAELGAVVGRWAVTDRD